MNELDLYMNRENYIDNIGTLYQPTMFEISKIGNEKYNQFIKPFTYTLEILDKQFLEEHPKVGKVFDMFFLRYDTGEYLLLDQESGESLLKILIESISFFMKKSAFLHEKYQAICVGEGNNETLIHRDNFDILADYILKINQTSRIEIEELPNFENDKQKDIYAKIMAGRRRRAQECSLNLVDVIKYVRHAGKSIIPLSEIKDMHIYQFYSENFVISVQDSYEKRYQQALAGADSKELGLDNHWIYEVKNKQ